jgi:hypothetical protein
VNRLRVIEINECGAVHQKMAHILECPSRSFDTGLATLLEVLPEAVEFMINLDVDVFLYFLYFCILLQSSICTKCLKVKSLSM